MALTGWGLNWVSRPYLGVVALFGRGLICFVAALLGYRGFIWALWPYLVVAVFVAYLGIVIPIFLRSLRSCNPLFDILWPKLGVVALLGYSGPNFFGLIRVSWPPPVKATAAS